MTALVRPNNCNASVARLDSCQHPGLGCVVSLAYEIEPAAPVLFPRGDGGGNKYKRGKGAALLCTRQ